MKHKDDKKTNSFFSPLEDWDYRNKLGDSGCYPFTRGIYPEMYSQRLWTMRQYAGYGSARQTNELFKYLLKEGQTGLSVAFDLPTQMGYDSDSEFAVGEVGRVGVAIDSLADMEVLFDDIPLDIVSTSMTINAPAAILFAMYTVLAEKQGVANESIRGTIQNDILKEYIARGTYIFPPQPSLRLLADTIEYSIQNYPKFNPISISGYHMREAGCTAAQELAFTFANAKTYIDICLKRGLDIDKFVPKFSFFFSAHNNFLEEVAKFRAARRIWATMLKEKYNAKTTKSMHLRFHTQTAGCTLAAQQPENNIVRVALQALSAVMGGTQSLHTNSFDEALCLPTQKAATIALRTQQIIAHETGITEIVDPLGGSYAIESLTDTLEKEACELINEIDKVEGVISAIEKGFIQGQINKAAYKYDMDIETQNVIRVGVNEFKTADEKISLENPEPENIDLDNLKKRKLSRDPSKIDTLLANIKEVAFSDDNLMPFITKAVKNYCTVGEICDALRSVWGEYQETVRL